MSKLYYIVVLLILTHPDNGHCVDRFIEHLQSCDPYEKIQHIKGSSIVYVIHGNRNNLCRYSEQDDENTMICLHSQLGIEHTIRYFLDHKISQEFINIRSKECKFYNSKLPLAYTLVGIPEESNTVTNLPNKISTIFFSKKYILKLNAIVSKKTKYINLFSTKNSS